MKNQEIYKSIRKGVGIMGTRSFTDRKKQANKKACRKGEY